MVGGGGGADGLAMLLLKNNSKNLTIFIFPKEEQIVLASFPICSGYSCFWYYLNPNQRLLGRFIHTYGTHIIVGMAIGGQDLICLRQRPSSQIPSTDLRRNLQDIGDFLFSDGKSHSLLPGKARDRKHKVVILIALRLTV